MSNSVGKVSGQGDSKGRVLKSEIIWSNLLEGQTVKNWGWWKLLEFLESSKPGIGQNLGISLSSFVAKTRILPMVSPYKIVTTDYESVLKRMLDMAVK